MRKLILIFILALSLISCSTAQEEPTIELETLASMGITKVCGERRTGVLYICTPRVIFPLIKWDGSCVMAEEWKANPAIIGQVLGQVQGVIDPVLWRRILSWGEAGFDEED